MKIVTFNIRLDWGRDGANNFSFRKDFILRKLLREKPDIICFQEVLPHVAAWLKESLPEYDIVGCPRSALLDDEQTCVAYRRSGFGLLRMEAFWLSPTPNVPGSRYDVQSPCPRICTEVILQELSRGTVFRLLNTHLDHEGQPARMLAVEQILEKLRTETFFPGIPVLLTGDMNAEPDRKNASGDPLLRPSEPDGRNWHHLPRLRQGRPGSHRLYLRHPGIHLHPVGKMDRPGGPSLPLRPLSRLRATDLRRPLKPPSSYRLS